MMPKGVEHGRGAVGKTAVLGVRIPMMPKGVEHELTEWITPEATCANSNDAERR